MHVSSLSAEPGVWVNLLCRVAPSPCVHPDLWDLTVFEGSRGLSATFSGYYVMTDGEAVNISATFPPANRLTRGDGGQSQRMLIKVIFNARFFSSLIPVEPGWSPGQTNVPARPGPSRPVCCADVTEQEEETWCVLLGQHSYSVLLWLEWSLNEDTMLKWKIMKRATVIEACTCCI